MEEQDVRGSVVALLGSIEGLVNWGSIPDEVKREWYSIMSRRVAAISKSAKRIEDFAEKLLKELAGESLFLSTERAKELNKTIEDSKAKEEEILEYIKSYPLLSVVFYAASKKRKEER